MQVEILRDVVQIFCSGVKEFIDERVGGVVVEAVLEKGAQRRRDHLLRAVGVPVVGHVRDLVKGRHFHGGGAVRQYRHAAAFTANDYTAIPLFPRVPVRAFDPLGVAIVLREAFPRAVFVEPLDRAVRYVDYVDIARLEPVVDEVGNEQVLIPVCDFVRGARVGVLVVSSIQIHSREHLRRTKVDAPCHELYRVGLVGGCAIRAVVPDCVVHRVDIVLKCLYPALGKAEVRVDSRDGYLRLFRASDEVVNIRCQPERGGKSDQSPNVRSECDLVCRSHKRIGDNEGHGQKGENCIQYGKDFRPQRRTRKFDLELLAYFSGEEVHVLSCPFQRLPDHVHHLAEIRHSCPDVVCLGLVWIEPGLRTGGDK